MFPYCIQYGRETREDRPLQKTERIPYRKRSENETALVKILCLV
ncbi:hypothetical protein BIFPSEUDO_03846 [Bifidobacterium pseudocatenulatum DSM 20438 = JCM 1200 = LMG 10505]|uniref:Uncharacterized protein n=1 Tax=Bifidobacterium pseudocatenulatum DSM 20438 = JCM 1200 = LMG 10505 TaxID=547043 RepID=C0BTW5_BIFPS|nr:hypothetical protein BIFPSEUDO_03846 [Bifidobacterium pseudocatenulatum DSM 20438 = JCM 1200 = LMG 10505]